MTPDPALIAAIDEAIAATGVQRYKYLCLDHPDPATRRAYSGWILAGRPAKIHAPARGLDDVVRTALRELAEAPPEAVRKKGCCG